MLKLCVASLPARLTLPALGPDLLEHAIQTGPLCPDFLEDLPRRAHKAIVSRPLRAGCASRNHFAAIARQPQRVTVTVSLRAVDRPFPDTV